MTAHLIGGDWRKPPHLLSLPDNEVHVWQASLDEDAGVTQSYESTLDRDERAKANRFHFDHHRRRFIVSHGILRRILAHYLELDPGEIQYRYNSYGKPELNTGPGLPTIHFNMSHTQDVAIYGLSRRHSIGVDVEYIRPDFAGEEIARQFFSPHEVMTLQAVPTALRHRAFFACWTRKEAYIKGRGEGLTIPLHHFDVALSPGDPPRILRVVDRPEDVDIWSLRDLSVGDDYAAAIAVMAKTWSLRCWEYSVSTPEMVSK